MNTQRKEYYLYDRNWIYVDGWRSSTVSGLVLEKMGLDQYPKAKAEAQTVAGRDGFVIQKRKGVDAYDRELVFFAKNQKALHKLYGKIRQGEQYHFILSSDPAYSRLAFVSDIEATAVNPTSTRVSIKLKMYPYKFARQESSFIVKNNLEIVNNGDAEGLPIFEIQGTGEVVITIGGKSLTVDFSKYKNLLIDTASAEVLTPDGAKANSALKNGFFLSIPKGRSILSFKGSVSGKIRVKWRYTP